MLKVDGINVYYGQIHALHDVSFEVNDGEIVTLIGANGAGKSTILKTVSGLMHSKTGSIHFNGEDISHTEPHKIVTKGLSQVPEGRMIFLHMTVQENLEMGAFTNKNYSKDDLDKVYDRFPRLKERRRQIAGSLSGGEQQMLAIGRALMINPKMITFDEPSMGLAPLLVKQIFDIIKELNAGGTTVLLVEQNARMALSIAKRGYVLENGRIVLADSADKLLHNEAVQKAYLGG
jgi:branched-chain amino acid transport system ATP-binding protein